MTATHTEAISASSILQRLARRTDLPADVIASLHTAREVVLCAEADHYQQGLADGIERGKEMAAKALPRDSHPCFGGKSS